MTTTHRFWLPDDLKRFVEKKVRDGGYSSGPEFVHDHVDRAMSRPATPVMSNLHLP